MYLEFVLIGTGDIQTARMVVMKEVYIPRPLETGDEVRYRTTRENTNVGQEAEVDSSHSQEWVVEGGYTELV